MAYIPKKRKLKLNYKVVIPLLVLVIFVGYFLVNVSNKNNPKENKVYTICDYSSEKSEQLLNKSFTDTYEFSDYLFYGESLAIFKTPYTGEDNDEMSGKTLKLKDVCSDQSYAFVLDQKVDRKILLGSIKPGFYEMYLIEDLKEKRLYADHTMLDSITTITRNGGNTKAELVANQELLKDYKVTLDHAYAFLNVGETSLAKDEYDIAIDPGGNDNSFTYEPSKGVEGHGLVEAEETYIAAQRLKKQLEAKGLKVLVLRNESDIKNTYGTEGRLAQAYKSKAKYYIHLGFWDNLDESASGFNIFHSSHATKMLASQIGYDLGENTAMSGDVTFMDVTNNDDPGVIYVGTLPGEIDGRNVYDNDIWLRESGGKATQAGMYSEAAQEGTGSFSKDNLHGMQGINLYFGYMTSLKDVNYWKEHKELVVDTIADAIVTYLNIEE